ncbi:MAG: 7-cyano-7-deazaguanine synthase QueC [Pseudomonadota bacterium]
MTSTSKPLSYINEPALVIFSGGQDSTTCLGWAFENFSKVSTVGYHYGQRHDIEMTCRANVLEHIQSHNPAWAEKYAGDAVLDLSLLTELSETSLTHDMAIAMGKDGLPNTFVPGRNLMFLTVAAAYAYRQGIRHIILGVCETDFSGYPDCRDDAMKAMQVALNIGMQQRFVIHTPLMWIDKAATWQLAHSVAGNPFIDLILEHSHTCYNGDRSIRHPWGYGCGQCPACQLRASGWEKYLNS